MKLDLPLEQMSVAEKIGAMELLWADLCKAAPDELTPNWHADVLAAREARLAAGAEKLVSWEQAKAELRRRIHDHQNS
jgi:hypothetical protein